MKTTPLPARDADTHGRYLRRQNVHLQKCLDTGLAQDNATVCSIRFGGRLAAL